MAEERDERSTDTPPEAREKHPPGGSGGAAAGAAVGAAIGAVAGPAGAAAGAGAGAIGGAVAGGIIGGGVSEGVDTTATPGEIEDAPGSSVAGPSDNLAAGKPRQAGNRSHDYSDDD